MLVLLGSPGFLGAQPSKDWLDEVDPIISSAERSVYKNLKTEEERQQFIKLFWQSRDSTPQKPENEFKSRYYKRLNYAESRLGGRQSDQGRIYIILGEPDEKESFTGYEDFVDCELWSYRGDNSLELPPLTTLIFYRPSNVGRYRLFNPGIQTSVDLLSPAYRAYRTDSAMAYNIIRTISPQLAHASLSVIPGEGDPNIPTLATSTNSVLAKIYSLPERQARMSYLQRFSAPEGSVEVSYSLKRIDGYVQLGFSRGHGFTFLNYAIMPEVLHMEKEGDGRRRAGLSINLKISDKQGRTIYQRERRVNFRLSDAQAAKIDKDKVVFKDFAPIIPGEFQVSLVFSNKNADECFVFEKWFTVAGNAITGLAGYKTEDIQTDRFMAFSSGGRRVLVDPRLVFNAGDMIEGLVGSEQVPEVSLARAADGANPIAIPTVQKGRDFVFEYPVAGLKPDYYFLRVKIDGREIWKELISVLPFVVSRPEGYEWSDAPSAEATYLYDIGCEYLNAGEIEASLAALERLPAAYKDAHTLPTMAQAYYLKNNYPKVISLLEALPEPRAYPVAMLLGNSYLKMKKYPAAAECFERLRTFGETAEVNKALGALYLLMGDKEKSRICYDRAADIEKKAISKRGLHRPAP
jgi:GWxTD domain-containing protein